MPEEPIKPTIEQPAEAKPEAVQTPILKPASEFDMKKVAIFAAAVVGIIIIGLLAYFMFRGVQEVESPEIQEGEAFEKTIPEALQEELSASINNLLLASSVDEDFNYLERTDSSDLLIPYSAIIAIGDFVIVSEEDLI